MAKLILILIAILFLTEIADAQRRRSRRWKRMRYEVIMGVGATNFLGELGGADGPGTNMLKDLEISMTRPVVSAAFRYKLLEDLSAKIGFSYGVLKGDDRTTNDLFRENRNLHFKSNVFELSTVLEYHLVKERVGHRYNLRNIRGIKSLKINTYFFLGVGVFHFNPKAKYNGSWYELQPLNTEGQGLVPTREPYKLTQMCIPAGVGFKYGLNRRWGIGLEFAFRKTFTDYLDDVSTTYYDPELLRAAYGNESAALSDPSLWEDKTHTRPNQQRGDARDNDSYMFMLINFVYKLKASRKGLPKF